MPDLDLSALRKVAEAATPGPWGVWGMTLMASGDGSMDVDHATPVMEGLTERAGKRRTFDVDFASRFDPPTVLALLDELERLQREARGPKFSERLAMAQQAWDEYRPVAKLTEPEPPTLFSAGYTMGISHGYQRRRP